jgi:hypothetical protein
MIERTEHGVGDIGPTIHYPCVQLEKKKHDMMHGVHMLYVYHLIMVA